MALEQKICKLASCGRLFTPKNTQQLYCHPDHSDVDSNRRHAAIRKKKRAEASKGRRPTLAATVSTVELDAIYDAALRMRW
jgi:hypothetical protein